MMHIMTDPPSEVSEPARPGSDGPFYSFEEYQMFYATTEKVTEWRQALNRFNYSVSSAIVVSTAVIANWAFSTPRFMLIGVTGIGFISLLGLQLCAVWKKQVGDYKKLNNAKFTVLAHMAPRLVYSGDYAKVVSSPCPFEREWAELHRLQATTKVSKLKLTALSASTMEYYLPRGFQFVYTIIFLCAVIILILNWGRFPNPLAIP